MLAWPQRSAESLTCYCLWKLDRFARDLVEQERTVRRLEFDGLQLVAMDGYDTAQKGGKVHPCDQRRNKRGLP